MGIEQVRIYSKYITMIGVSKIKCKEEVQVKYKRIE